MIGREPLLHTWSQLTQITEAKQLETEWSSTWVLRTQGASTSTAYTRSDCTSAVHEGEGTFFVLRLDGSQLRLHMRERIAFYEGREVGREPLLGRKEAGAR